MNEKIKVSTIQRCFAILFWIFLTTGVVHAASPRTQYIFMVDTSGSMVGLPEGSGAVEIFPRVKAEIISIVEEIEVGDTVDIIAFDKGVQSKGSWDLLNESIRQEVINHINALRAEGANTWVYQSIREIVQETIQRHKQRGAPELPTDFFVFTDGRDNHPDKKTMSEMLDDLARISRKHDYLYYVTLGIELSPEEKAAFEKHSNFEFDSNPPGVLHKIGTIRIRAKSLDFGFVEGNLSSPRDLVVQDENVDGSVQVEITASFDEVEKAGSVILIEPEVADLSNMESIQLRIRNRESLPERHFEGELHFDGGQSRTRVVPNSIPVRFKTIGEPVAELFLPDDLTEVEFGSIVVGEHVQPRTASVVFNQGAINEKSKLYVWIVPGEKSSFGPSLSWNDVPFEPNSPLVADRIQSELRLEWGNLPSQVGEYRGEIVLSSEDLVLQGGGLVDSSDGRYQAIGYVLQVESPPAPLWMIVLFVLAGLLLLLILIALVVWILTGEPPWIRLLRTFVVLGLVKPSLKGKLVAVHPDRDRMETQLKGKDSIVFGEGGSVWQDLPDQFEIRPQLRKRKETVFATLKSGKVTHQARGEVTRRPLSGQELKHGDVMILSDRTEIQYLKFSH